MKKIYLSALSFALAIMVTPVVSFAADDGPLKELGGTFDRILTFINDVLIPFVFALALLMFLYGVFKYFIVGGGDESKRQEGRQMMLYSIIGFVAMISIFGIVNIVAGGLGLDDNDTIKTPEVLRR